MGRLALLGTGGPLTAAYVGPFDGITFAALYGLKRFLTSYTGPLIRLRRNSDNAEDDFYPVSDTGLVDQEAIDDFLGVASPFMPTWYDQSGNGRNATQSTTTKQPAYVASGINSLPALDLDGTDDELAATGAFDAGAAFAVATYTDGATFSNYDGLLVMPTGTQINLFIGSQNTNDLHQENSAGYPFYNAMRVNGTLTLDLGTLSDAHIITGIDATPAAASGIRIGNQVQSASRFWGGLVVACGITTTAFSVADHNTIGNELADLYGLTWNTVS